MHVGMRVIRDEHRTLAAVVDGLVQVLAAIETGRNPADFDLLSAFIAYIEGFPARQHHPKEDAVLFPAVRRCTRDLDEVIAELHRQHEEDYRQVAALRAALEAWRGDPAARGGFIDLARTYASFTIDHINIEEGRIIKALPALLTDAAWAEVDAAFGSNVDPLISRATTGEFAELFHQIVLKAPAPVGLGD